MMPAEQTTKTYACHVCPGFAALAARHDVEKISVTGLLLRESQIWSWTCNVQTDFRVGHATASTLDQAVNQAVAEIV